MNLTRLSLGNPVAVAVAVLLVFLFGAISLARLPVQMTPDVERPQIAINTSWRAAAPEEVESEIIEPQEEVLRGLPGLIQLESSAGRGSGSINLHFANDMDMDRALLEVMNRMNQVPNYPPDAREPVIINGGNQFGAAIAWFALRTVPGNDQDIASYEDFVEEVVKSRFERIPGIANANAYGGRSRQVRVTFDPYQAAAYGIEIPVLASQLSGNEDSSAGFNDIGRRQYTIRYGGQFEIADMEEMVLAWRDGSPIRLRDVAEVEIRMVDPTGTLNQNGGPSMAINALPEQGINVLETMRQLKLAVEELQDGPLEQAGLSIEQVYDETEYIEQSIAMLRTNLLLGITLAIAILWWFLRRFRATLMVAVAIPVSLFVAFVVMFAAGRTLNIISLAGLAFSVGMVLDAAIVVLENIVRLREEGAESDDAASRGTSQVIGALFASTTTTVAIFLPVVFLEDTAGQLFGDLALAIAVAVITSFTLAATVIPAASTTWLRRVGMDDPHKDWWDRGTRLVMDLTDSPRRRLGWIVALSIIPISLALLLKPEADYLPEGKRNLIFASLLPPPGLSVESSRKELAEVVNRRFAPYLTGESQPQVDNYFMGVFGSFGFMGARASDAGEVDELLAAINGEILADLPDTQAFASRASLFGRFTGGRVIDVDVQSRDIEGMLAAARVGMGAIPEALPGASVRPIPGVELAQPELRLRPDDRRIAEVGWNRRQVGDILRALGDGLFVGDYFDGDRRLDMILRGQDWEQPETFSGLPLSTPSGEIVPVQDLVSPARTAGPDQVRRVDRRRTVTLRVTPPADTSLEFAVERIQEGAAPAIAAQLPEDGSISYRGSADDLSEALKAMGGSFLLAIAILYLLMSALFRSFKDSLLVIWALPLATVGGVLALRLTNLFTFQPMDLLTMIGFITVLGLVVNNAILLVYQTRNAEREGMDRRSSVENAVRLRLRPILMSTLTSLFGMLPLVLIPGAGTELYRGMASVIVGGMAVSTMFTLVLLPSLLRLGEERGARAGAPAGRPDGFART